MVTIAVDKSPENLKFDSRIIQIVILVTEIYHLLISKPCLTWQLYIKQFFYSIASEVDLAPPINYNLIE